MIGPSDFVCVLIFLAFIVIIVVRIAIGMRVPRERTVALDDIRYHTSRCTIESDHERTRLLP